ncbi:LysR-family transcriptional regulator [Citreicella sp. SE45]|uniref:DNA-binding transcriptional regulator, LysR family n=1 Tax=Salipiger thiooxidans TaxID=282683 RepID=A0A1G7K874_9RHOB|nr:MULTISPECIES: LysR family transcriptional regulator [Salipiger]EEX14790.1 LysR-family transcriptional regulator [Citreicella sp. SE45]MAU45509.1 LysR family transcriptional regulator [Salipiger sp.]NIY98105.1 LysR family transcriptional regulator [Salipiger sp. HF18]SDF33221.1 DNA-binding transcriptional regulator, LysR family [Salipiger thiooxidans]
MRYTLRQIEYFIATAEAGSITLAAERINISQPSISTAISQLEAELGAQLFLRRHAQGLSLTRTGRELLAEAKQLMDQAQKLYHTASEATEAVRGTLSLGCLVTFAPMVLPEVTHSFATDFPGVRVLPQVSDHEQLLHGLERAELDIALSYDLHLPDEFEFIPLAELPPYALVAETDPLASEPAVTLGELAERDMILLDLPQSRDYFLALFARMGLVPKISARLQQQDVIRTMVANRFGYTIANIRPKSRLALDGRSVAKVRIAGDHKPMRLGLLRVARQAPTRLVGTFMDHCATLISNSYIPGMEAPIMDPKRVG